MSPLLLVHRLHVAQMRFARNDMELDPVLVSRNIMEIHMLNVAQSAL